MQCARHIPQELTILTPSPPREPTVFHQVVLIKPQLRDGLDSLDVILLLLAFGKLLGHVCRGAGVSSL